MSGRENTGKGEKMSRYIDADTLPRHGQRGGLVHWKDIAEAQTIDIVRCKDCKSWKWIEWAKEYRCTLRNTAFNARADDFCSYGEREGE